MLERLAAKLLQHLLSKYFEQEPPSTASSGGGGRVSSSLRSASTHAAPNSSSSAAIWSGFVTYHNLRLKTGALNQSLMEQGRPFRVECGLIRNLTITIPWGKLASTDSPIVVVLDGVFVLMSLATMEFDDDALKRHHKEKRRRQLREGTQRIGETASTASESFSWKEYLKRKLQEGLLPALSDRIEIHCRDFHFRVEDTVTSRDHPYAFGIVLESLHVQKSDDERDDKFSQLNHLGIYLTSVEERPYSDRGLAEHSAMKLWSPAQIVLALDRTIARRISDAAAAAAYRAPAHSYLLMPVDGALRAAFATPSQQLADRVPPARLILEIPHVNFELRDVQCLQLLGYYYETNTHKYRRLHYRLHRPYTPVRDDPRAWWRYLYRCACLELRKHRRKPFPVSFARRQRYCELYERQLVGRYAADDAAGPTNGSNSAVTATHNAMASTESDVAVSSVDGLASSSSPGQRPSLLPLSLLEEQELRDLDDGVEGDMTVQDILLFRILVHKRIGFNPALAASRQENSLSSRSWFRRVLLSTKDDDVEQDYQRLVSDWQGWTEQQARANEVAYTSGLSPVAVSVELAVAAGHVSLFSPLESTADQTGLRRLQQKFLYLTFTRFEVDFELMRDFDTAEVRVSLLEYVASELRGDQTSHRVVSRADSFGWQDDAIPPILNFVFSKTPHASDFHIGLQARVRALQVLASVESEWTTKLKSLIRPLPQFEEAAKFWKSLNMASINSWMSDQLGLLVKANTLSAEHKRMNIDIQVDCPVVRLSDGQDNDIVLSLGRVQFRTEKLAGDAHAALLDRSVRASKSTASIPFSTTIDEETSYVGNGSGEGAFTSSGRRSRPFSASSRVGDKSVYGWWNPHCGESVDFGASVRYGDSVTGDFFLGNELPGAIDSDAELYFYDVFELRLEPGGVFLESTEEVSWQVMEPMEVTLHLLKSVLQADHTLSRYKIRGLVPEVSLSFSERVIAVVATLVSKWSKVLSSNSTKLRNQNAMKVFVPPSLLERGPDDERQPDDSSDYDSSFDENEFFDTNETDEFADPTVALDETWMADAESIVDSEARLFVGKNNRRGRRRQMSDVSSISDASLKRNRVIGLQGAFYLSAENLARLEEEGAGDESAIAAVHKTDDWSYQSAVSVRHVEAVEQEIADDIAKQESQIDAIRIRLSGFRSESSTSQSTAGNAELDRRGLRLELERAQVQLKTLRAALKELSAKKQALYANADEEVPSEIQRQASISVKTASSLLVSRRRLEKDNSAASAGHALTQNLRQDSLVFSLMINTIRIGFVSSRSKSDAPRTSQQTLEAIVSHFGFVLTKRPGDSRLFVSVEHLDGSFIESEQQVITFLNAGVNYEYAGSALPSRFPHLVSSLSIDDKLLKFTLEVKEGLKLQTKCITHVKARLVLGDVEATISPVVLMTLAESADRLKEILKTPSRGQGGRQVDLVAKPSTSYHVNLRFTSVRCLLRDDDIFAAAALTDAGFRLAKSPQRRLRGQRSELAGRCGNMQLLWIRDFETGRGIEIFGKRDAHNPIMLVRLRTQEASEFENGGWIVDSPPTSVELDVNSLVLGMHLGIRIEGFSVSVTPESLESVGCRLVRMRRFKQYQKSTSAASEQSANIFEKPRRQKIRWRADCLLRKSFVSFQDKVEFRDDFLTNEMSQKKLLASFTACFVVQPSESLSNDTSIQVHVQDASFMKSPGDAVIIEPVSFALDIVAPLANKLPKASRNPRLCLRESSPWAVTLPQRPPKLDGRVKCQVDVSCSLSSDIKIRLSPSTLRLILELVSNVSLSLKRLRAAEVEENEPSSMRESKKAGYSVSVSLSVGTASFAIVRDILTSNGTMLRTETTVLFCVEGMQIVASKSLPAVSLEAVLAYGSVIDYSHRAGIQTLKSGYRFLNASAAASAFLEIQCSIDQVAGKRHLHSSVRVGNIQFLPLPSCIKSVLDFMEESKRPKTDGNDEKTTNAPRATTSPFQNALKISTVAFEAQSGLFECILSSKDLPKYLCEMSNQPIGVVTLRLKVRGRGLVQFNDFQSISSAGNDFTWGSVNAGVENSLSRYLSDRVVGPAAGFCSELEVTTTDFQVLRTTILRSLTVPIVFAVKPPLIGEQRITNAFNFSFVHRAACSSFFSTGETTDYSALTSVAHSLDISAETVDVLLYISQSSGGVNDAVRTSAVPILDLLKKKNGIEQSKPVVIAGLKETIVSATFTCSVSIKGFVVTCVPGGATRLTESPIVKLSLSSFSAGLAMTPVSGDWKLWPQAGDQPAAPITDVKVKHIFAGGWLICDISAYYNNRRLVEWEPFVEPWKLELLLGADVSRASNLGPVLDDKPWHTQTEVRLQPQPSNQLDFGGSRLRDIGRLLRSPFQTDNNSLKTTAIDAPKAVQSDIDFCYLILISMSSETASRAAYPRSHLDRTVSSSLLPHDRPIQWLIQFGYPAESDLTSKEVQRHPALICKFGDSTPLNLNLTGALLENLSDYLCKGKDESARRLAPHWIRNDSGLTLRFQEILDEERLERGEQASTITLVTDTEVELPLKRSSAQSCDPHVAFISIELGSFEDTVGRVNSSLDVRKGARSTAFAYRVRKKIPVDTVGVRRYPVDLNAEKRDQTGTSSEVTTLGYVIVRVALNNGIKIVTIESPLFLKNASDVDFLCEVRDHDGLSLLWRSLIPKASIQGDEFVPMPADIVPTLHTKSCRVSIVALARDSRYRHESEVPTCDKRFFTRIYAPRPYARNSLTKGVIDLSNIGVRQLFPHDLGLRPSSSKRDVNVNLCSIRVGSISLEQSSKTLGNRSEMEVPEQRMLIIRSTLAVVNHLAFPLRVQARVKQEQSISKMRLKQSSWFEVGVLDCGEVANWSGASASDKIELRVRFERSDGSIPRKSLAWSTIATVPPDEESSFHPYSLSRTGFTRLSDLKLQGACNVPLSISCALSRGTVSLEYASSASVKQYAAHVPEASRVVGLYVPLWIIDGTGLELQFKSGGFISSHDPGNESETTPMTLHRLQPTLGLGELLDDRSMANLPSRHSYEVFMIGNEGSNRLHVRRRTSRLSIAGSEESPWSDAIPLTLSDGRFHDTNVYPPSQTLGDAGIELPLVHGDDDAYALRSRLLSAPAFFGGHYGTKLVHVVCRYAVINDLGREIEIMGYEIESRPTSVFPTSRLTPIHFNDTRPIRFRPKEFGWAWSGRFYVRKSRRELTLSLSHKIKGIKILVTVEVISELTSGTCILVFREAPYPPYRIENRTVFAMQLRQVSSLFESSPGTILLPYHDAEFAWDEPESSRHIISLSIADLGEQHAEKSNLLIGTVRVDRIAPGTTFRLRSSKFTGQVVSDGPTRVLRITETDKSESINQAEELKVEERSSTGLTWMITAKLQQGIGVSVVDWTPQELLYVRLEEIFVEKFHGGAERKLVSSIGRIVVNNQLWVTPYPVTLRVGSKSQRRRHRRHAAITLSWNRREASGTGQGNMTMFQSLDLSMEPFTIFVDGNLTKLLIGMFWHARHIGSETSARAGALSRNQVLNEALRLQDDTMFRADSPVNPVAAVVDDLYHAVDTMATSAIASKLRSRYRSPAPTSANRVDSRLARATGNVTKGQHKFYIEKLRISSIAADISWSGALPITLPLPGALRPAFTFEGLPVLLRPVSSSHSYGTIDDHIQTLRSHYISIWRVLDLLVGVLRRPSFLARAVIYTWRESLGSAFDAVASRLQATESSMAKIAAALDARPARPLYWSAIGPFVKFNLALVHGLAAASGAGSHYLRYSASSRHRDSGVLVRSRNPRLFANVNGKDLLVEYVEGESAGKAFLSRVSTGTYLGEGYNFHAEGIRLSLSRVSLASPSSPSSASTGTRRSDLTRETSTYILMLTFERVLLLSGALNASFCDVVWDSHFADVVYVEVRDVKLEEPTGMSAFVLLVWWFLQPASRGVGREERISRAFVSDIGGLDALESRELFVPSELASQVLTRLHQTSPHWIDHDTMARLSLQNSQSSPPRRGTH